MARGGINKALVQTARLALLARGEHPSIDAVRIEMGNTGSKTTIHRYLRELDESDRAGTTPSDIDDELTELVTRLAHRLQGKAQETVDEAQSRFDATCHQKDEALLQANNQLAEITARLNRKTEQLKEQAATLLATRERLQTEQTQNARLTQANQDLTNRLADKDEQIRSLEEKTLKALESAKQQREQEQRRYEEHAQQLQTELRQTQSLATQHQQDITRLTRDNERLLAENRSAQQELNAHNDQLTKASAQAASTLEQLQQTKTRCTVLEERTRLAQQDSAEARQQLTDQLQQNRVLELILIKTELALEGLRNEKSTTTSASKQHPDQR
ncbi:DNA-binding protein [Pseudomonas viridiflava]|uniref:DNA-binding protein n=1 Tax=Pseudomonas viridiflava TaxID=33069 RepID=UPI000F0462A7|nr:DNA-binding protein [Pseudomonas viridiflava]